MKLDDIEKEMRQKFPDLPEEEIVGSDTWKKKLQSEKASRMIKDIKGIGEKH